MHLHYNSNQGPLITDGRNSNEMRISFHNGPWHFKVNEDIITKFEWHGFQIIRINRKKFGRSGITPSYFPTLMSIANFVHFSQYRAKPGFFKFSSLKFPIWWTDIFSQFELDFYYKNPVQTRKKIQYIKLTISNWRIWKIQFR